MPFSGRDTRISFSPSAGHPGQVFTGLKRPEEFKPYDGKRSQGAVDARRQACRRTLSYFKCPGTPQMRFPANAYHSSAGFTLMEVIVALSVVAIALLAIYRMHTQTLFMDARGRFDSVAVMLARQKLAELETVDPAEITADSGDFGSDHPGYTWKIETENIESDLIRDDGPILRKIRLTIGMNEDEFLFQLTTYRHLYEQ